MWYALDRKSTYAAEFYNKPFPRYQVQNYQPKCTVNLQYVQDWSIC